jgi:magnesium-transporting ATPase (P-type)
MLQLAASWAAEGLRVIAVAQGQVPREALEKGEPPQNLKFLGFAGISDPLRPDAPLAVQRCQQAGIEVRLVTGDHPKTALAVASDLGIAQHPNQVLTGTELREAGESAAALIARAQVFARVEPMQKLQIVETLRETGHFVAVTGDGVNDAPALRAANVGVAMGQAGTDVARAAADLIITDDNFASIVNGIEEGRIAYNNVRRVTLLLLATGFGEIVLFLLTLVANLPLPLFAVQLLWLNLVTNGIQDIALAFERSDRDVLKQKPRPPEEALFDGRMAEQVLLAGLYMGVATFFVFQQAIAQGWSEAEARTTALLMMVLFENVQALNSRSERVSILRLPLRDNPVLISSILLALGLHLASAWIPGLGSTLGIVQPTWYMIVSVLPLALGLVVVMELYKRLRGRIL